MTRMDTSAIQRHLCRYGIFSSLYTILILAVPEAGERRR